MHREQLVKDGLTEWWAQDADTIGKAAIAADFHCLEGKREKKLGR